MIFSTAILLILLWPYEIKKANQEWDIKMGISKKLALYIFVVSVLFLIIALIYNHSQACKISLINETYSIRDSADDIAQFVSKLLTEKAQRALSIAQSSVISEELIKRNEFLGGMDDQAREKKIGSLDNLWIETKDENDPFIQGYLDNPVADYFHRLEVAVEGEYGEIFLTDKYGALVASTAKLTTLAHAHKYWWQGSYNEGSGRVFFDDRGYDDSVGDYVLGIVVPVRRNEEIIGILKCNFMVLGAISSIIENFKNEGITIGLARSGGQILYESGLQPLQAQVPEKLIEKFVEPNSGSIVLERKSGDVLTAYSPIPLTLGSNNHEFGGSAQSIDHRHGNRGESWYIYLSKDFEAVYALARERTNTIMMTGLALIMIMAVVSIILGYILTKPINKLALVTKKIGDGDLNVSEIPDSKDEIGQLGKSIKNMADSLKHTMIRRDELIEEVESHRQTSEALRESEEKLQTLFSAMTEMVVLHELVFDENDMPCNYRILDCNQAFCRITGIKKETAVGKTATQFYKTETPPYLDVYAKVALSSEPTEFFTEYAPLEKHFLVSVVSPRKHFFATITSDITEVKQA